MQVAPIPAKPLKVNCISLELLSLAIFYLNRARVRLLTENLVIKMSSISIEES